MRAMVLEGGRNGIGLLEHFVSNWFFGPYYQKLFAGVNHKLKYAFNL